MENKKTFSSSKFNMLEITFWTLSIIVWLVYFFYELGKDSFYLF